MYFNQVTNPQENSIMKSTITHQAQPAKKLRLKKESIAVLSTPRGSITGGSFGPTASCNCTGGCKGA
jgi:hypothetical protein